MTKTIEYFSYLLRIWRETEPGQAEAQDWYSQIEHIQSGQHWTFHRLDDLLCFLQKQTENSEV